MEAPKKIYVALDEIDDLALDHRFDYPICTEYTRTDAFIEKACDAYCEVCGHYPHTTPKYICRQACDYYKDFKNHIKGE